jgi:hypothetical protein
LFKYATLFDLTPWVHRVLFQLLLTFDPILVEKVASLLYVIMQDNPVLSRLYLTGAFFFVAMYTGGNVLPIARFLKYTHTKQAFRSDEVKFKASQSNHMIITCVCLSE